MPPPQGVDNVERGDIKALFFGAKVLVTGGSGFVGKVLIESLLRKTDVDKIYILIRNKKNKTTEERLQDILKEPIFRRIRAENPQRLSALIPINGDCSLPNLGISESDRNTLIKEIEIVYHGAATVTFNENLKLATEINVVGTKCIMELARKMKNLKVVMHVSTAYSNSHQKEIDEKIYPVEDKIDLIKMAEALDYGTAHSITKEIIKKSSNTYIYTKRYAEDLIEKEYKDMPVGILRPGVVIGSLNEPIPGWVDNLYGPTGLVIGIMMGIIHSTCIGKSAKADIVPVDTVTNCLISSAWDTYSRYITKSSNDEIPIYNVVSSPLAPITWGEFESAISEEGRRAAPSGSIWMSFTLATKSWTLYRFIVFILHYIAAYVYDTILTQTGQKAKWVRLYQRTDEVMQILLPFSTREFDFKAENVQRLWKRMSPKEKQLFPFSFEGFDWKKYLHIYFMGVKEFMIKNPIPEKASIEKAKRLFVYNIIFCAILLSLLIYLIWWIFC